jgi:hypothetical protein
MVRGPSSRHAHVRARLGFLARASTHVWSGSVRQGLARWTLERANAYPACSKQGTFGTSARLFEGQRLSAPRTPESDEGVCARRRIPFSQGPYYGRDYWVPSSPPLVRGAVALRRYMGSAMLHALRVIGTEHPYDEQGKNPPRTCPQSSADACRSRIVPLPCFKDNTAPRPNRTNRRTRRWMCAIARWSFSRFEAISHARLGKQLSRVGRLRFKLLA